MTEHCDDPNCLICHPLVTKSGRVLTDDDVQALAAEAERGYDIDKLRPS